MQLDEAVAILNRERHRGHSDWYVFRTSDGGVSVLLSHDPYGVALTEFEAIAIAEKYERAAAVNETRHREEEAANRNCVGWRGACSTQEEYAREMHRRMYGGPGEPYGT